MKILICGDRNWKDYELILNELEKAIHLNGVSVKNTIIIHGAAKGADSLGATAALQLGVPKENIFPYPAEWSKYGKAAGPMRNMQMLMDNPDINLVLAFHDFLPNSKGTKDMVKQSEARKIKVKVIGHER